MIILRLQGLPWSATAKDIRQHFEGLSIPDGGVHIIGGEEGDVFIAFATDDDARKAMQRQKQPLNGSRIMLLLSSKAEMQEVIAESRATVQMRKVDPFAAVVAAATAPSPPVQTQPRGPSQTREAPVINAENQTYERYPSSNIQRRGVSGYPEEAPDASSQSYPSSEYGSAYFNRRENQDVGKDGQGYGQDNRGLPSNNSPFGQGFEQDNQSFGRERQDFGRESQSFERDSQNVGRDGQGFGQDNKSFGHEGQASGPNRQGFDQSKESSGHDSQGFGQDNKGYGCDSVNYGHVSQNYRRDSQGFGQSSQGFERDAQGYGIDSQGYRRDGQGVGRDGQHVRRDDQDYGRDIQGFERNRSFGQENQNVGNSRGFRQDMDKQDIERDNQSYQKDPQMFGRDGRDVGQADQRFGKNTPDVMSGDFAEDKTVFRRGEGQGPIQGNRSSAGMQAFGFDDPKFGRDDRGFDKRSQIFGEDGSEFRRDGQVYRRDGEVSGQDVQRFGKDGQGDAFRDDKRAGSSSRVTTEGGDNVLYGQAHANRFSRKDVPGAFDLGRSAHSREREFEQNTLQVRTQSPFGSNLEGKRDSIESKQHPFNAVGKPQEHWQFDEDGKLYQSSESQRTLLPSPAIESNTPEDEYMEEISTSYPPPGHSDNFDRPESPFDNNKPDHPQPPAELWKLKNMGVNENTRIGGFNVPKFGDATWVSGGSTSNPPQGGSGREFRPDVLRRGEDFDRRGSSPKEEFSQRLIGSQLGSINQPGFNRNQFGAFQEQAMNRSIDFDNRRNMPNIPVDSVIPKLAGSTPGGPPGGLPAGPPGGRPGGMPGGPPRGHIGGPPGESPSGHFGGLPGGPPSGPPGGMPGGLPRGHIGATGVLPGGHIGGPPGGPPRGSTDVAPGGLLGSRPGGLPGDRPGGHEGPSGGRLGGTPGGLPGGPPGGLLGSRPGGAPGDRPGGPDDTPGGRLGGPGGLPSGPPSGLLGSRPGGAPGERPGGPDGPPGGRLGGPPVGLPGGPPAGLLGSRPGSAPGDRPGVPDVPPGGRSGGPPVGPPILTTGGPPSLLESPTNVQSKLEKKAPFFAVHLAGLPYSCSEKDLRDFLKGVNIASEGVQFHTDKRGKLTGTANVKVESKPDKDEALRQNKRYMGKRYIDVTHCTFFDWENGMKDSKLQSKRERSRSPARSTKSPIRGSNTCVEIKGMSSSSRDDDIKNFFEGMSIGSLFVERGKDGYVTAAYVEFKKPDDVKKACQKSGTYMGKRTVSVREISKEIVEAKKINDTKKRAERRSPGKRSPDRRRGRSPRRDRSPGRRGRSPSNRSSSNSSPGRNGPGRRTSSPSRRDSRDRESSRSRNRSSSPSKKSGPDKMETLSEKKETLEPQSKESSSGRSSKAEQRKDRPSPYRSDRGNGESKKSELPKQGSSSHADMRSNDRKDGEKGVQSGSSFSRREGRESRFGPEKTDLDRGVQDGRPPGLLDRINAPVVDMRDQPINNRGDLVEGPRRSRWENSQGMLGAENEVRGENMPGLMDDPGKRNMGPYDGRQGGGMGRPQNLMDDSQMRPFDRHGVTFPEGHGGPFPEGRRGPFPDEHGGSSQDERRGPLLDDRRGPFPSEDRNHFPDGRGQFPGENRDRFPDAHGQFPDGRGQFPDGRGQFPDERRQFPDGRGQFPDGPSRFPDAHGQFPDGPRGPFSDDRGGPLQDDRGGPFQEGRRGPYSERSGPFPEGQGGSQDDRRVPSRNWQEGRGPTDERHGGPGFHDQRGQSRDDRDRQERHMDVDQGSRNPFDERHSRDRERPDNFRGPINDRKRPGEPWHSDHGENRPGRNPMEDSGNRRGLLEDPGSRRGLLDDPVNKRGLLEDPVNRRGLLDSPEVNRSDVPEKRGRFDPNEERPVGNLRPNRRDHSSERMFEDEEPRSHFPNQQRHGRDEGRKEEEMRFNQEGKGGRQGSMDHGRFENQERRENIGERVEPPEQTVPPENDYSCAHIRNMPYQARWPEIAQFFHGLQIVPGGIHIMMGPDGRPMGHCFVEFVNPHQARQSEERRLQTLRDRPLQINACSKTMMIRSLEQAGELPQMVPGQRPPFGPRGPRGPGFHENALRPSMGPHGPNFGPRGPRPGAPFRPPFEGPQTREEHPAHQNDPSHATHSHDRSTSRSQDRQDSRSRDRTDSRSRDKPSSQSRDESSGSRKSDVSKDRSDSTTQNRGSDAPKKEESKPTDKKEEKKETPAPSNAPTPTQSPAPVNNPASANFTSQKGCVVSATNLPLTITVDAIRDFFKGFETVKGAVKLDTHETTGKATGQAKIAFVSPSEANRAIKERNNRPLNGRIVRLHVV